MSQITIPNEDGWVRFDVTSPQTAFPFGFVYWEKADLIVLVDGVVLSPSAWTHTPNTALQGGYDGGVVTLNDAVDDVTLFVVRLDVAMRTAQFAQGPISAAMFNGEFNRIQVQLRDLQRDAGRAIKAPVDEAGPALPGAAVRANTALAFGADGSSDLIDRTDLEALGARIAALDALSTTDRLAALDAIRADFVGPDTIGDAAALLAVAAPGIVAKDSAGTPVARTLEADDGLAWDHPAGAAGNPKVRLVTAGDAALIKLGLTVPGRALIKQGAPAEPVYLVVRPDGTIVQQPSAGAGLGDMTGALNLSDVADRSASLNFLHPNRVLNLKDDFGAKGDGRRVFDAVTAAGNNLLGSDTATFTSADIGKRVCVKGAGAAGADYFGTVTVIDSATGARVSPAFGTSVSAKEAQLGTDDTLAWQAALDAKVLFEVPEGIYIITDEIHASDGSRWRGAGAFWKRRTSYRYTGQSSAVVLYHGVGGANTCVFRCSEKAVGVVGSSFGGAETDDLINVRGTGVHIDANNRADYGWYVYRAGNQAAFDQLTGERARRANHVHLGCFAAFFGVFGAYEANDLGVICGADEFGWSSAEATNFAYFATFHTCNNGTDLTFVEDSGTDKDGAGGWFEVGRGSVVTIVSEGNKGRAAILSVDPINGGTGGPAVYNASYIEGNAAGALIEPYGPNSEAMRIGVGFIHPGNGSTLASQNFKIVAVNGSGTTTANEGPANRNQWMEFYGLHGDLSGTGFAINSNTFKYRVLDSFTAITYPDKRPQRDRGVVARAYFRANSGLTDTRVVAGGALSRTATPAYRLTFDQVQEDANYSVAVTLVDTTVSHFIVVAAKTAAYAEIRIFAPGALTTPVDPDDFVDVIVTREMIA